MSIKRYQVGARMSQVAVHNGVAYLSGQCEPGADVTEQAHKVFAEIDKRLAEVGSDKSKILRAEIWLADMADFAAMNAVWDAWVVPGHTPARATCEAKLALPEFKIEVTITAAV